MLQIQLDILRIVEEKIAKTREELEAHERAAQHLREAIDKLRKSGSKNGGAKNTNNRGSIASLNAKMKTREALLAYLTTANGAVPMKTCIEDLTQARVKLGKLPERYSHNIKIVIANNKDTFIYNEKDDTLSLKR